MITTWTSTWGLTAPEFLWGYGALCVTVAAGMWAYLHDMVATHGKTFEAVADLGVYELALLSGGPPLAITSAATKLHGEGALNGGPVDGTLRVSGELGPGADRLERAVFETVSDQPYISADALRAQLEDSEPVRCMTGELTSAGLLVERARSMSAARWTLLAGGLLATLGIARLIAAGSGDGPAGLLLLQVVAVGAVTLWAAANAPFATHLGREILTQHRDDRDELRSGAMAHDVPLAAALFGGGTLWLVSPASATALGIPREDGLSSGGEGGWDWVGSLFGDGDGCGGCGGGGGGGGG